MSISLDQYFKVFYSFFFIIYQLEDNWSIMKLGRRPLTLNSYKDFQKNKNRSGKQVIFYKIFEKQKKKSSYILFYYQQNFTSPQWADIPGFPTSVENMMSTWINTWGRLRGLKMLLKNTCHGVHMLVKLPAISLQACKFVKNELLHT